MKVALGMVVLLLTRAVGARTLSFRTDCAFPQIRYSLDGGATWQLAQSTRQDLLHWQLEAPDDSPRPVWVQAESAGGVLGWFAPNRLNQELPPVGTFHTLASVRRLDGVRTAAASLGFVVVLLGWRARRP